MELYKLKEFEFGFFKLTLHKSKKSNSIPDLSPARQRRIFRANVASRRCPGRGAVQVSLLCPEGFSVLPWDQHQNLGTGSGVSAESATTAGEEGAGRRKVLIWDSSREMVASIAASLSVCTEARTYPPDAEVGA